MKFSIQDINKKLEAFFEGKLPSVFNKNPLVLLTEELINAVETNLQEKDGEIIVPNIITIKIEDKAQFDCCDLKEWETLADQLIKEFSRENSFTLGGPIKIEIIFDETIDGKLQISTHQSILTSGDTISISLDISDKSKGNGGLDAFLILWDEEYFKITKNVTNIGRQEENDLVIDNLRVSRIHAQIRRNSKGFNIIDSNSTSGTKVNGHLIDKHQLSNGDVIEIADVPLIFNTDEKHDLNARTRLLNIKKDEREDV